MLMRRSGLVGAVVLAAAGLAYALLGLIAHREMVGDQFPEYSTLRADPRGAKALLDALNATGVCRAERNYAPLVQFRPSEPATLIYLNVTPSARWEATELEHFEELIQSGSRAVFFFEAREPVKARGEKKSAGEKTKAKRQSGAQKEAEGEERTSKKGADKGVSDQRLAEKKAKNPGWKRPRKDEENKMEDEKDKKFEEVAERWGFAFATGDAGKHDWSANKAKLSAEDSNLELLLPCRSALYFKPSKAIWKPIYRAGEQPVVMERAWGAGSIVVATDPFVLSNEALRGSERCSRFISWMIGGKRLVIFDEEHLGISEQGGVMTLARKHGLQGLMAVLVTLAALFIWQSRVSFLPDQEEDELEAPVEGRSNLEGFIGLLRRSVPRARLLQICLDEWRRAYAAEPRILRRLEGWCPPAPGRRSREADLLAQYGEVKRRMEKAPLLRNEPRAGRAHSTHSTSTT